MHIRVITKNHLNPAYGGALFGARAVATAAGYELRHSAPQKPDDVPEQAALIIGAIAEKPEAIVLIPAHETGLNEAIREVNRAGIPLVSLVAEASEGEWICFVGADDVRLTRDVSAKVLPQLPEGAHVAIMDGHPDSITTPKRQRGFREAVASHPGLRLVDAGSGYFQQEPARKLALEMLSRHPRLDAMLVANDLMAMGVLQALEETGRKLLMVSVNGTPEAVAAVKQGKLVATASFNTLGFGSLGAEAAVRHLRGETVPRRITLRADIIDRTNCGAWDRSYEERPRPDWQTTIEEEAA